MSAVSMMSLMPTGTPLRVPTPTPDRLRSSAARAWSNAWSSSRYCHAWTVGSTAWMRSRQAPTSSSEVSSPCCMRRAASLAVSAAGDFGSIARSAAAVEIVRQPERHAWPEVHDDHADDDDDHVGHHPGEDLVERDVLGRDALQVERRHRHWRRQESRLQVDEHERAPQDRVDAEMLEQRQEDWHEYHDDLGPL